MTTANLEQWIYTLIIWLFKAEIYHGRISKFLKKIMIFLCHWISLSLMVAFPKAIVRRRMECGIQLSCMQTVSDWEENMAKFPASIQWSQVQGEGRNAACCKYKPESYLAEDCRMPQFLHLYHQGRGHSPCHHQLQRSSEWTRQRTDIII